jgi:hypothetical protein
MRLTLVSQNPSSGYVLQKPTSIYISLTMNPGPKDSEEKIPSSITAQLALYTGSQRKNREGRFPELMAKELAQLPEDELSTVHFFLQALIAQRLGGWPLHQVARRVRKARDKLYQKSYRAGATVPVGVTSPQIARLKLEEDETELEWDTLDQKRFMEQTMESARNVPYKGSSRGRGAGVDRENLGWGKGKEDKTSRGPKGPPRHLTVTRSSDEAHQDPVIELEPEF